MRRRNSKSNDLLGAMRAARAELIANGIQVDAEAWLREEREDDEPAVDPEMRIAKGDTDR